MRFVERSKRIPFVCCLLTVSILLGVGQQVQAIPPLDRSKRGMVTSAHPLASEAGLEQLKQGGNAIDAAVAATFAISVVEPFSAGLGGGGFLLMRQGDTGQIRALDFRERAPLKATRTLYLDKQGKVRPNLSIDGYLAVAVPGTVAGLYEVHQRYGKLPWKTVLAPAIRLAEQGFPVSERFTSATDRRRDVLTRYPASREIFLPQGQLLQPGELLVQPDLAKTLQTIAQDPSSFYQGKIAQAIVRDMAAHGGLITLKDLETYHPTWREPVCGAFRQVQICSMPPPSSGGVHLLQMLNIIGDTDLNKLGWHHPDALHLLIETMRIAYADRSEYLGDPAFTQVPVKALISPAYAAFRRRQIDLHHATPSSRVRAVDRATLQRLTKTPESSDTSHLSVVDQERNAVSLTFTVNYGFGSGVVVPGMGILLNDEMDDFAAAPGVPNVFGLVGGEANAIAPGKIPLSSMTPTIITEKGQLRMLTGSPGGSTIITTNLQIILNVLVYGMDVRKAVAAPRFHHQWLPDQVRVEQWGFDTATLEELRRRGQQIEERPAWGNASAIVVTPDGWLEGAADPRGEGTASGF
ncbi:MAG: gamma-glutamyltransferase [Scytolyngbya sp. HA4215-MV1]|jgi:gamma-glutamyltranspeptidase/glutathione hydrolase|nr:gamma-glutamyltransferase [Scytolyngbya sp. HA4215-MV1]